LTRKFEQKIRQIIEEAQQVMIASFSSHPVTLEIEGGPDSKNSSNTLVGASERANLFGFIGFGAGENPVQKIRSYLAKNIEIRAVSRSQKDVIIDFAVNIPELNAVYEMSPMPWAPGLSWAEGIEKGIPGLGQYLAGPKGRSGGGIQVKVAVNAASFRSVSYMSKILEDFVNDLTSRLN
jgi:hypothetical protein